MGMGRHVKRFTVIFAPITVTITIKFSFNLMLTIARKTIKKIPHPYEAYSSEKRLLAS
jgi:hypothetical protein